MSAPRLVAISPGEPGYNLRDAITTLGAHGWPTLILREAHRTAAENDALIKHARAAGVQRVIVHEKSPHTITTSTLHVGEGWSGEKRSEQIGVSCHSAEQIHEALSAGALYTLLSPLFAPTSKPLDLRTPLGLQKFLHIAKNKPVLALGGVNTDNYAKLLAAGVYGVAIMGGIFNDPTSAEALMKIYRNQKTNNSSS